MGNCMSSDSEEVEQKKKSQAIDKVIEEDSKRLRKECKILLLGEFSTLASADTRNDQVNYANVLPQQAPERAASPR